MKNLHYMFALTLLFAITYSCKTDSIDACDTNCSKCVIKSSKTYDEKDELTKESSYEYDDYFTTTKTTTIRYSKGAISSTELIEHENFYEGKSLIKTVQRNNGQLNNTTTYSYHPNGKVKRTEKRNKENIVFSIDEINDGGKSVYSFYKNTSPGETVEIKSIYDSKNNELSNEQFRDGNKEYSFISEYNSDNTLSKKSEIFNYNYYLNEKPYSQISTYKYDLSNRTTEIKFQYIPSRVDIYKIVQVLNTDKNEISLTNYIGNNIQYQQISDYNEKGKISRFSSSKSDNPLIMEIRQEYFYHPNGKLNQIIVTFNGANNKYASVFYNENGNEICRESWNASKSVIQKTLSIYSCVK
jgi:hypothetical protein